MTGVATGLRLDPSNLTRSTLHCAWVNSQREKFYFSNWVNSFSLLKWKEGSFEDTRFVCDKNWHSTSTTAITKRADLKYPICEMLTTIILFGPKKSTHILPGCKKISIEAHSALIGLGAHTTPVFLFKQVCIVNLILNKSADIGQKMFEEVVCLNISILMNYHLFCIFSYDETIFSIEIWWNLSIDFFHC